MKNGTICVALSNVCNLNCIMCGSQNMEHVPNPTFLSAENWNALINKLPENYNIEINSLGEHTLHPNFLEFIERAIAKNISLKISTNGMWPWNEEKTDYFLNLLNKSGRTTTLVFSIDGAASETVRQIRKGANHKKIMANIRKAIAVSSDNDRFKVMVAYCVMVGNFGEMQKLIEILPGLNEFYINLLVTHTPKTFERSSYPYYQDSINEINATIQHGKNKGVRVTTNATYYSGQCSFPYYLWMDIEGSVYPCCRRYDLPVGNIAKNTWQEILDNAIIDLEHPLCKACLEDISEWSWRQHFGSEEIYKEYLQWHEDKQKIKLIEKGEIYLSESKKQYEQMIKIGNELSEKNHGLIYTLRVFSKYINTFRHYKVYPKRIIEIGHGQSKLMGRICQQAGIEYYGVDPRSDSCWNQSLELEVLHQWSMAFGFSERASRPEPVYVNDISKVPDGWGEALFSHAVLEHVQDLDSMFDQFHRILKPGGMIAHQVDLRSHRDDEDPTLFLTYTDEQWEHAKNKYSYINRLRSDRYKALLEKRKFIVDEFDVRKNENREEGVVIVARTENDFLANRIEIFRHKYQGDFSHIPESVTDLHGFVAHLMRSVRHDFVWGNDPNFSCGVEWPDYETALINQNKVTCGPLCHLFGTILNKIGISVRYVDFRNEHVGLEAQIKPGLFVYYDPTFLFCMLDKDNKPMGVAELRNNIALIREWENRFSQFNALLPNMKLSNLFENNIIRVNEIEIPIPNKLNKIGIVGEAYCGSTILSLILGSHPDIFNAGEVHEIIHGSHLGDRALCQYCRAKEQKCRTWSELPKTIMKWSGDIHNDILKMTGAKAMVDMSKSWRWFNFRATIDPDSWLIIHLVKSPYEQVASYMMRRNGMDFDEALNQWINEETQILEWCQKAKKDGLKILRLRYRDFMLDITGTIKKILQPLGLEFQKSQLRYWEQEPQHYIGGNIYPLSNYQGLEESCSHVDGEEFNRERYRQRQHALFYDDKWKEALTQDQIEHIHNNPEATALRKTIRTELEI